jgi:hypothetical protein
VLTRPLTCLPTCSTVPRRGRAEGQLRPWLTSFNVARPTSNRLLPIQLRVGDHFTEEADEWEVIERPVSLRGGKIVRATIQRPGRPETAKEKTWDAYQHLTIGNRAAQPKVEPTAKRSPRSRTRG